MSETIRINGVDVPIDSIAGVTGQETTEAYRRHRKQRQQADDVYRSCPLHSGSKFVGTPRLQKHRGGRIDGVRVK